MKHKKINLTKERAESFLKKGMNLDEIANELECSIWTVLKRFQELNIKPLGASYFNKGANSPAKRKEISLRISKTVKGLWDKDVYKSRINGMAFKYDWEYPNFKPKTNYRDYLKQYQPLTCYYCGRTEKEGKIDIHHLDENRNNWLLSNLLPVCSVCHVFFHYPRYKTPHITIGKRFRFESAHHLLNYVGPCERSHGHSYTLIVYITGPVNRDTGMVIDYKNLSDVVKKYVINKIDHQDLTEILDCNTTAENIIQYIWEKLEKEGHVKGLSKIVLKETEDSFCELTKQDMLTYYTLNKEYICSE